MAAAFVLDLDIVYEDQEPVTRLWLLASKAITKEVTRMCILFFQINHFPQPGEYRLVLAANRDEFYDRPAIQAAPWIENNQIIGGRDMTQGREGGTWFAVKTQIRSLKFGALLNVTGEAKKDNCPGRGNLVKGFLESNLSGADYLHEVSTHGADYHGFNLVTGELNESCGKFHNYCNAQSDGLTEWSTGDSNSALLLGFSNSPIQNPFGKVTNGLERFGQISHNYSSNKDALVKELLGLLQWKHPHWPDPELARRSPQWGQSLSSVFVKIPQGSYGTRTHTILLVDSNWRLDFIEDSWQTGQTHIVRHL